MIGKKEKVVITPYENSEFLEGKKSKPFELLINPSGYSIDYKTNYNKEEAIGKNKTDFKFESSPSPFLNLEFLLDGTGVAKSNPGNTLINKIKGKDFTKETVADQLDLFYNATGEYDGTIHKPHHVKINWGTLEFLGVLLDFTIEYKLFTPEGYPLRAIIKAKFGGSVSQRLEKALSKPASPDLTHKRTVKAGDTLPLMTERIYGDSKYYLEVAKVNNLINFRQLKPGTELYFPPIEKIA